MIPSVKTILDLSQKSIYRYALAELEELLKRRLHKMAQPPEASFTLYSFFGSADDRRFQDPHKADLRPVPLSDAEDPDPAEGRLAHPLAPAAVAGRSARRQEDHFRAALDAYTKTSWREPTEKPAPRYTMAMLHNPKGRCRPAVPGAPKFIKAGESLGITIELVEKRIICALRSMTLCSSARTLAGRPHLPLLQEGEKEGMVVIDDPNSILKCTISLSG